MMHFNAVNVRCYYVSPSPIFVRTEIAEGPIFSRNAALKRVVACYAHMDTDVVTLLSY
jgi:hypothetical protein